MTPPLVSILIPAWNASAWIAQTLESALAQTHPHVEIIVVDDGSTDDTLACARRFESRGVRVVTQPNAGAAAARNHALRLAGGEFLQFLDADDLLSPRKLERQLALLASRPAGTVATCRWGRFETDPAQTRFVDEAVFRDFAPLEYLLQILAQAQMMHPGAWLTPRTIATAAGPWDESLSLNDDGEYFTRIVRFSSGLAFAAQPDASSYYRSNLTGSLSGRRSPRALHSLERSAELIIATVLAMEDSPRMRRALADFAQHLCYELYPEAPAASQTAERRARDFGGSTLPPPLGHRQRQLARFIGWRLTKRLAHLLSRAR